MCLGSTTLCNISLYMYFSDSVGVRIGIFLACSIHYVSSGVGRRENSSNVLLSWDPLVVLSRNRVPVIGDLVQS